MTGTKPAEPEAGGHHVAMWLSLCGLVAAVVVAFLFGPRAGSVTIAAELVLLGMVRTMVTKAPYGIAARSRVFDATVLISAGLIMGAFALTAQNM